MMTELQAVNRMLAAVGESPVVSLDAPLPEVLQARDVLSTVSLEVQSKGWHFNSDSNVKLSPDGIGNIFVATNALRVDATDDYADVTVRGGRLYDKSENTYTFKAAVLADVVWFFAFDTLPQAAKHYIYIKAARRFQREYLGSASLEKLTEQDEQDALVNLLDFESAGADYNLLTGNQDNLMASLRI